MLKHLIQKRLESLVKQYFKRHPEVKLIVVSGSVGKTSTKRAIATVLSQRLRVGMEDKNHNTHISAPLAILGIEFPEGNVKSPLAWINVILAAKKRVNMSTTVDVIIQELGTDHSGEIAHFGTYLRPDIGVVTGVTPEHMEYFGTIDAVAVEELTAANFSELAVINRDDIDGRFASYLTNSNLITYGTSGSAEYRFEVADYNIIDGFSGNIVGPGIEEGIPSKVKVMGEHSLRSVMAAVAIGLRFGLTVEEIQKGLSEIRPVPGRMNVLKGIDQTIVIDDTYNSSPAAASAAIQALYSLEVPERIVILGDMNELGATSAEEHEKLGMMCDPNLLSWVITIGDESEKYLAPAAKSRGCQVKSFKNAIEAGAFARSVSEPGAAILVKGSQGGVYAEEAVKMLVLMSEDVELVRQSPYWTKVKDEFFSRFE